MSRQPSLLDFSQGPAEFDPTAMTIAPSPYPQARETSALAAVANAPRRASQNDTILRLITAAGEQGISDLELHWASGFLRSTICARRGDLRGLIEPAATRYSDPMYRTSFTRWKRAGI